MAAAWPSTLPPPLRTVAVLPGANTEAIDQASGRRIVRNWGHRSADQVTVQFRIKQTQEADFKNFWHRVGMDVTWFTASWLPDMMYPNHKARLLGYPRRKGITGVWMDFSVTLLVMQAAYVVDAPPWLSAGSGTLPIPAPDETYFAVGHGNSPFVSAYLFFEEDGVFGAKRADPSTLPGTSSLGVSFSPTTDSIAVVYSTTPFISVYPWDSGFGTKVSNPGTLPTGNGQRVVFSPAGDYIAVAHTTSPFVSVYPWTGAFGTKVSNPSTLPTGGGLCVSFSPAGDYIVVGHSTTPFISAYDWSAGFGTKVSNPGTLPKLNSTVVTFSPNGSVLAVGDGGTPWVTVYAWSAGFGTKFADPSPSIGNSTAKGIAFSPDGNYIALGNVSISPYIFVYPWIGGFGTKVANPDQLPVGGVTGGVRFSPGGGYLAMASHTGNPPGFDMYVWAGGFGGNVSNPMIPPTGQGFDVAFGVQAGG